MAPNRGKHHNNLCKGQYLHQRDISQNTPIQKVDLKPFAKSSQYIVLTLTTYIKTNYISILFINLKNHS